MLSGQLLVPLKYRDTAEISQECAMPKEECAIFLSNYNHVVTIKIMPDPSTRNDGDHIY